MWYCFKFFESCTEQEGAMPQRCSGPSATGMSLTSYMDVLAACPERRCGIAPTHDLRVA